MKKIKKPLIPKTMSKYLLEDIKKLIHNNQGKLFLLEVMEEIPYEYREIILESISTFYEEETLLFYDLLKIEYGKEFEEVCNRAIKKLSFTGLKMNKTNVFEGEFHKAYATVSRHTGKVAIDIAWKTANAGLHVECFYLSYNSDGVHSFFLVEEMPEKHYEEDRKKLIDMKEISFEESAYLIQEAFNFNIQCMTRPALGRFLYQKYLDKKLAFSEKSKKELIRKLSLELSPKQLVNSFFNAIKCQDHQYIDTLFREGTFIHKSLNQEFQEFFNPGNFPLEGHIEEIRVNKYKADINAYSISMRDQEVLRNDYNILLGREEHLAWEIIAIDKIDSQTLNESSELNPFAVEVDCRVYEIVDLDELFSILDKVDNLRGIEELPYGIHLRFSFYEEELNQGISLLSSSGLIADLVINGDEFVVIARDQLAFEILDDYLLGIESSMPLEFIGEYRLNLMSVYNYLGGQYFSFEDLIAEESEDYFENAMRYLSVRYLIKDKDAVFERLEGLHDLKLEIAEDLQIYYQLPSSGEYPGFMAEYMLGDKWLTVSAFGEKDIRIARNYVEKEMYESMEFDGMEIRENGIFDVLSVEVKKQYPQLEEELKDLYLNKWYYSRMSGLKGMTPSEASESEEGNRLLWDMFKKMKKKKKKAYCYGGKNRLNITEFVGQVEKKNREKIKRRY